MAFRFFNKTINYRRFDYAPMYYDERKERREEKKREFEALQSGELSAEERKRILRNNMRGAWAGAARAQKAKQQSNWRIILLIAALLILGYFVFNGVNEVDTVVKKLW